MTDSVPLDDPARRKRELRLRIGRLRRRIDRRLRSSRDEGRRLLTWKTYVQRFPGIALLAAVSLGITAAVGIRGGSVVGWLGWRAVRRLADQFGRGILRDVERAWSRSSSPNHSSPPGADPDGS